MMNGTTEQADMHEKQRMREEIDAQVQAFLSRGGEIDVVSTHGPRGSQSIGLIWHEHQVSDLE